MQIQKSRNEINDLSFSLSLSMNFYCIHMRIFWHSGGKIISNHNHLIWEWDKLWCCNSFFYINSLYKRSVIMHSPAHVEIPLERGKGLVQRKHRFTATLAWSWEWIRQCVRIHSCRTQHAFSDRRRRRESYKFQSRKVKNSTRAFPYMTYK